MCLPRMITNMALCVLLILLLNPSYGYARFRGASITTATTTKALYVFGDSLFDAGNNQFYTPKEFIPANHHPYGMSFINATGRHSDGLLVPDFIAEYAGIPQLIPPAMDNKTAYDGTYGYNFASAGSGCLDQQPHVMNLHKQLDTFEEKTQELEDKLGSEEAMNIVQNAVYMFSAGGNDYLTFVTKHKNVSKDEAMQRINLVVQTLTDTIEGIYKKGGRKFAFQDVGPLGCMPTQKFFSGVTFTNKNVTNVCDAEALKVAQLHNAALRVALENIAKSYSDFKYGVFDYYNQLLNRLVNPEDYGFKVSDIPCCGLGGLINGRDCGMDVYFLCSNPYSFVLFDGAHTTQHTNSQLAKLMWRGGKDVMAPYNVEQLYDDNYGALEMA